MKNYYVDHHDERTTIAYDESMARFRNAFADYAHSIQLYDRAVKRLRSTQERFHKDDSILCEVIKEIQPDSIVLKDLSDDKYSPDNDTVKEKKAVTVKANIKILEEYGDILSEGTKEKLEVNL